MHSNPLPTQHRTALLAAAVPLAGWAATTAVYRRRLDRARRDPLTGLHTREVFTARAEQQIRRTELHPSIVVLVIDLDRFKHVNDTFGHQAGDAVLFAAAHTIEQWAGDYATVARIGGDEFAVIGPTRRMQSYAEHRLAELAEALSQPLSWEGTELPRGASIGGVRLSDLPEPSVSTALAAADAAMYRAKQAGGGWQQHTPDADTSERRWSRNRPASDAA